jgi:hypothetical protein
MTTPNASRSPDGTTVTITLSAEQAERALSATRYVLSTPLENYPEPWNEWNGLAPFGTKEIDEHLAGLVALTGRYRGLLEQFEAAGVRDWSYEIQAAYRTAMNRTGDVHATPDPLPPASTGPVTVTATSAVLTEVSDELLSHDGDDREEYRLDNAAGESIREQLEATR